MGTGHQFPFPDEEYLPLKTAPLKTQEDSESPLAKRAKTSSRDDTLPPELDGLTEKDYHRITSAEVVLDKDHSAQGFEKGERYSMAMSIASEDGDQPAIDITSFISQSYESLERILGSSKLRPPAPPEKITQNTIVRLVNVIFSQGFIQGLMEWNNHRKRADHETGVCGTMDRFLFRKTNVIQGWFAASGDCMDGFVYNLVKPTRRHPHRMVQKSRSSGWM
ncbi:hypothetical protein IV203_027596 [Nitzschia inconspicua]|uniref:Uncharacterized protein n=1 Tax=Nitzschia inconspicua TaxID=303405 RepID=A0A9K3Q4A3_9STRA|nr:hypothetical protein IV203_027596 [Nitzschia inconspicua]